MASRVAEILMAQGQQAADAARAKGAIWGGLAQELGSLPGEALQSYQKQKQQTEENKARKARLDLDTAHLGLLQQEEAEKARTAQHAREGVALTSDLVSKHSKLNPETGHYEYDHEAIANGLLTGGHPEAAGHYMDLGTKIDENLVDIQNKHLAFEARKKQGYADIFGSVANAPEAERPARYGAMMAALPPTAKNDPVFGSLPPIYPGHQAFAGIYDAQQTDAQRLAKHKEAAEEYAKGLKEIPPGGKLVHVGETGEATTLAEGGAKPEDAAAAARAAETERHHRATEKAAGAKAASDKLVKVEHMDESTGRTVIEWLPQSELQGRTFKKGTGATTETRLASAQAVNQTGEDIVKSLSDPKIAAKVGPAMGRFNSVREWMGNPPPELSELAGSIESYSLANMGVHGMRSAQGAEQIKKLLDQKHTPESLIAAIRGLNKFSSHFMENEGRGATGAGVSAPSAVEEWERDANGKLVKKSK